MHTNLFGAFRTVSETGDLILVDIPDLGLQRLDEKPWSASQDRQVAHCCRLGKPLVEGRDARRGLLGGEKDTAVRHLETGGHAQLGKPNRCVRGEIKFLHFEGVKRRQDRVKTAITDRRDKDFGQCERVDGEIVVHRLGQ